MPGEKEPKVGVGAPAPEQCAAEMIFHGHRSAWCLSPHGPMCRHALRFGKAWICVHPQRERIAARTLERKTRGEHSSPGLAA